MRELTLRWSGPHNFRSESAIGEFVPPSESGVYIWLSGAPAEPRVSYVGSTGDLRKRFYEHCIWTLGGGYWLWDVESLRHGASLQAVYKPDLSRYFQEFVGSHETLSRLARENLLAYDFLWVTVAGGKDERETVESALIALARQCGCELQNEQNPRLESRCRATHYRSVLPRGLTVVGLPTEFSYGEQE